MSELQLFYFFWAIIGLSGIVVGLALLQVWQSKYEHDIMAQIKVLKNKQIQSITVLIYAKNNINLVSQTLDSIRANNYSSMDVVIIYEGAEKFNAKQFSVPLLRRRIHGTIHEAYKAGYRKSKKAKTIVTLRAGDKVDSSFLKRAAVTSNAKLLRVIPLSFRAVGDDESLLGLVRNTSRLIWHKRAKSEVFAANYFNRVSLLDPIRLSSATASWLSFILLLVAIAIGLLQDNFMFIWYVWLLFTAYLLAMIWLDTKETIRGRLQLTVLSPSALFLLPITSCVLGFSQFYKRK